MAGPCNRRNAGKALTNNSSTPVPTFFVSFAITLAPAQTPVLTKAPTPT